MTSDGFSIMHQLVMSLSVRHACVGGWLAVDVLTGLLHADE